MSDQNGDVHDTSVWLNMDVAVSGVGTLAYAYDTIYTGEYTHTPYAHGTFTWAIPWEFRVNGGDEKQFAVVTHYQESDSNGAITLSKGGTTKSANLNDPTTTY